MAQTTQGVKVGYGKPGVSGAKPSSWSYFPDLTGFPSLAGSNSTIDVTTLNETNNKIYLKGLSDLGGTLEFPGFLTTELYTAVNGAITAQETDGYAYFCVEFPEPFSKRAYFKGEIYPLAPSDGSVDAAVEASVRIIPRSDISWEDIVS